MQAKMSGIFRAVGSMAVIARLSRLGNDLKHSLHRYPVTYSTVFVSAYSIITIAFVLLMANFYLDSAASMGLIICGVALVYIAGVHMLLHCNHRHIVTYLLLLFYVLVVGEVLWSWGIDMSLWTLTFSLIIVLTGILLSAAHALFTAVIAAVMFLGVWVAIALGWITLSEPRLGSHPNLNDVVACCIIFIVLALVVRLYIQKRERSLATAKQVEAVLLEQKAALKVQGKKHMSELRQMQLEEMRYMYHFAELGQHGITLLHDIANQLTALKLETKALQAGQHAKATEPTRQIVQGLDDIVVSTCKRLYGDSQAHSFNLIGRISETIDSLQSKATEARTKIDWKPPAHEWRYTGDAASLGQVLAIVINNAIGAYGPLHDPAFPPRTRRIAITLQRNDTAVTIRVSDWGKGIPKNERKYLFQPFHSTKRSGLGLGLYIAKSTMEMQFSGNIELDTHSDHTEFVITLPRTKPEITTNCTRVIKAGDNSKLLK